MKKRSEHFTVSAEFPSCILSTFLCYNKDVFISNKPIYLKHFSNNNLNYVTEVFNDMEIHKIGLN